MSASARASGRIPRTPHARAWGWVLYAFLLALAGAAALAARGSPSASPDASIDNAGPLGIRALYLYLIEIGAGVAREDKNLTRIDPAIKTLIIAAPSARELDERELRSVRNFVELGGTLVYLASAPRKPGRPIDDWLGLHAGAWIDSRPLTLASGGIDLAGATADVWLAGDKAESKESAAAARVHQLRISSRRGIECDDEGAIPIAGTQWATYGLWRQSGMGEVWAFAGPDVAQNRRIELLDNARLWELLAARGPVLFDEAHHHGATFSSPVASGGLIVACLQFLACAAFFAYAQGSRLGPPRPQRVERHRSSAEYLFSLAWLTRRSRVERELLEEMKTRFRITLQDRLRISPTLPDPEAAQVLQDLCRIPRERFLDLASEVKRALAQRVVTSRNYASLARRFAELERIVEGRAPGL